MRIFWDKSGLPKLERLKKLGNVSYRLGKTGK